MSDSPLNRSFQSEESTMVIRVNQPLVEPKKAVLSKQDQALTLTLKFALDNLELLQQIKRCLEDKESHLEPLELIKAKLGK